MKTASTETKLKCVTFMVLEEKGKTVLQPITSEQDTQNVQELFQKNNLEVWLPNGQSDFEQFDVCILKYKQVAQLSKMCDKIKNRECLKNHFETIVSCEQCPLADKLTQTQR
jgi:hypothetical protein